MANLRNVSIITLFLWIFVDAVIVFRHKTSKVENRDRFSLALLMISGPLTWAISIGLAFGTLGAMQYVDANRGRAVYCSQLIRRESFKELGLER